MRSTFKIFSLITALLLSIKANATNYVVNTNANLQSRISAANPGDTVTVANGTYSWGQISITNTKGTSTSAWIVLRAETFNGVVFTGNTYLQFSAKRLLITGFKFANGNSGYNDVIQFRNSSSVSADYCRLNNITIENYSSDTTGAASGATVSDNKWVSIYGIRNRVDHCTFIDKWNGGATVVVWYDNSNYPQRSTPTYHLIDSNYFNKRSFISGNGGESIRVGVGLTSSTYAYNVIEYNLFENLTQTEPEVISNKSGFNTYRYNTIKNSSGGLTLRRGRYCSVYGNFIIDNNPAITDAYGIRIIDKGHRVFNNYIEGVGVSSSSFSTMRCPIVFYNGFYSVNDTTDVNHVNSYMPADSSTIAFNTIVNCLGGPGVYLGFTDNAANTFQPLGVTIANNLIKMSSGQAAYLPTTNNLLTYFASGNMYNAPNGLGLTPATGFTNTTLTFGSRVNGILTPPSVVQDAAINSSLYSSLLNGLDANGQTRSSIYDVGCDELNASGTIIASPLDSTQVGAGKPLTILPVQLICFVAAPIENKIQINWHVANEIYLLQYEIQESNNGIDFKTIAGVNANHQTKYNYLHNHSISQNQYYRLKMIEKDGSFKFSNIILLKSNDKINIGLYPNPAKGFIIISVNKITANSQLVISDMTGKIIQKMQVKDAMTNFSTNYLINGMYTIQLFENDTFIQSKPFIVSKN